MPLADDRMREPHHHDHVGRSTPDGSCSSLMHDAGPACSSSARYHSRPQRAAPRASARTAEHGAARRVDELHCRLGVVRAASRDDALRSRSRGRGARARTTICVTTGSTARIGSGAGAGTAVGAARHRRGAGSRGNRLRRLGRIGRRENAPGEQQTSGEDDRRDADGATDHGTLQLAPASPGEDESSGWQRIGERSPDSDSITAEARPAVSRSRSDSGRSDQAGDGAPCGVGTSTSLTSSPTSRERRRP